MKRNIVLVPALTAVLMIALFTFLCMAQEIKPKGTPPSKPLQPAGSQEQKAPEPLVPAGKEADITIFFTGDAIGYIEECG